MSVKNAHMWMCMWKSIKIQLSTGKLAGRGGDETSKRPSSSIHIALSSADHNWKLQLIIFVIIQAFLRQDQWMTNDNYLEVFKSYTIAL